MGNQGYNAGGYSRMLRVWCPLCGWSYLLGNKNPRITDRDAARPKAECAFKRACAERVARKAAKFPKET